MNSPIAQAEAELFRTQSPYAQRARYRSGENGFDFSWPEVPMRQFLAERDRAIAAAAPTGLIPLDSSDVLACGYPATTPTLLCRYFRIRPGELLQTSFVAAGEIFYVMAGAGESSNGGDVVSWHAGDVFCFPGGARTVHTAGSESCVLFGVTDEPLLAFQRLRPPSREQAVFATTHWPSEEIESRFDAVWARPITAQTTGSSIQFTSAELAPTYNTSPAINCAINTLAPECDQRAHRHNGAAVTLAIQGDGIHSMIDRQRVDWSTGAAQITPATKLHSHHNKGTQRMRSFVIQDEGLHFYTRTVGFSFD
ncbi:MAG: cupin domain-containing protein [Betaproteobacteria bacterium]|nr:cupin domain-containing protein [Betaproteobacteria bacterium]